MDRWFGKVAVVTGASSGIGSAIVEDLVKSGVVVVGLARRLKRLETLELSLKEAKGKLYPRECDVRKEEELLNVFKWVNAELGGVDILVNNAGVTKYKKIIDDDIESIRNILETNVLAMAISIREAVASMKKRNVDGYVININSVAGHQILDRNASIYTPSKWAVTALTETVRKELAQDANNKIKITSISPGVVKTEFRQAAGLSSSTYDKESHLDPEDISDAVLYVLGTKQKVQVTELTIKPTNEPF